MALDEDRLEDPPPYRHKSLWHMIAAPIVWACHFAFVYGWTASACAHADAPDGARAGVAIATAVAIVLIVVIGWYAWKQWDYLDDLDYTHAEPTEEHRKEFLGHAAWLLAIVSAIGVAFVAAPAFYIETCL